ncbi:MBOAT family O-acyltransferase [Bradyrhizobium sp.]|uniref:MBOAT family O-acyltransferase n=1 Tax=Bradyrhizobium sp. TaxID=376 RepID=UPI004037CB31
MPTTLIGYFLLQYFGSVAAAKMWLIAASLAFYSWWGLAYLPLITVSILVNYGIGTALGYGKLRRRELLLVAGLIFNLALLGYFKYANFLVDNLNVAGANIQLARIALPLAISFFTFQKIAYLVDSYRGQTVGYNFLDYALFVTFFPQLIAGPIVHHKEIVPQFANRQNRPVVPDNIATGLCILGIGLFKKVIVADTFAGWATPGFDTAASLSFVEAWVTSLSYTFQLYFDFSGYTDMAIGAALMFNIHLPINFNAPYRATDIQGFWRRWHITLSNFLRDYLYIPLGGSRRGEARTYENLVVVFLLGGLWHGASWMFVIWGALHGAALVIHRMWSRTGFSMPTWLAWFITFNFVNVAWVFFRAKNMSSAAKVLGGMADVRSIVLMMPSAAPLLALAFAIVLLGKPTVAFFERSRSSSALTVSGLAFGLCLVVMFMETSRISEFLYFNF